MKQFLITIGVIVALVAMGLYWAMGVRNGLIEVDEQAEESWAQISVQLERRADLVPNLVNTVKGYASHEKEIFTAVAQARAQLLAAKTPADKAQASGAFNNALGRLLAISENYPQLKANQNFLALQDELAGTENRIAVSRTRYNGAVKQFNARIRKFPGSLFVGSLGFEKRDYYEVADAKKDAPKVQF